MYIKVSILFGFENGSWFNLVVKSIFCSYIKKLNNFSVVFDSMSMYFAVLLLRKESFDMYISSDDQNSYLYILLKFTYYFQYGL